MKCRLCGRPLTLVELPSGKRVMVEQRVSEQGTRYRVYKPHKGMLPHAVRTRMSRGHRLHEEVCPP